MLTLGFGAFRLTPARLDRLPSHVSSPAVSMNRPRICVASRILTMEISRPLATVVGVGINGRIAALGDPTWAALTAQFEKTNAEAPAF